MDGQKNKASEVLLGTELLDACIVDGIATITKLGGYIMLFSLISGALSLLIPKQWPLYGILKAGLEITSGIRWICQSKPDPLPKYLSLMALCSFGGGCALIQTVCAASMKKQMIVRYLFAKLITVTVSILLTLLLFL